MSCTSPLTGHRDESGRVSITKAGSGGSLKIACGKCLGCKLERSRQWAVRCMHEAETHEENSFVTLTYDDEHLPPGGGLDLADWQRFAKATRKRLGPFRYFHCGEYGDMFGRAHLHACLFGISFRDSRFPVEPSRSGEPQWESEVLDELWKNGRATIGELTHASAAYCARYVIKKQTGDHSENYGGRKPPYVTMSRKPGLGAKWIERYASDVFRDDGVVVEGRLTRPPRYYESVLSEEELCELKAKRQAKGELREADQTDARLRVRERVLQKKFNDLVRR